MPRPTKQEIDDEILEAAASLFARHGFRETSVQRIADAVGYSKTGLLHRYPSKEALQQAVVDRTLEQISAITAEVAALPAGAERDRAALTGVARLAVNRPGTVRLLLSGLVGEPDGEISAAMDTIGHGIFALFAVEPECHHHRALRVIGALGALALARIAVLEKDLATPETLLADLVEISFDALGHPRPAIN